MDNLVTGAGVIAKYYGGLASSSFTDLDGLQYDVNSDTNTLTISYQGESSFYQYTICGTKNDQNITFTFQPSNKITQSAGYILIIEPVTFTFHATIN